MGGRGELRQLSGNGDGRNRQKTEIRSPSIGPLQKFQEENERRSREVPTRSTERQEKGKPNKKPWRLMRHDIKKRGGEKTSKSLVQQKRGGGSGLLHTIVCIIIS